MAWFRAFLFAGLCWAGGLASAEDPPEPEADTAPLEETEAEDTGPSMSMESIAQDATETSSAAGVQVPLTLLAWISALSGAAN